MAAGRHHASLASGALLPGRYDEARCDRPYALRVGPTRLHPTSRLQCLKP
jgi:hypothetical protein